MFERSGDRAVLLDSTGTTLFTLNPVGSLVWNELDGVRDATALAEALIDRFDGSVDLDELTADIVDFLAMLEAERLVVDAPGPDAPS